MRVEEIVGAGTYSPVGGRLKSYLHGRSPFHIHRRVQP